MDSSPELAKQASSKTIPLSNRGERIGPAMPESGFAGHFDLRYLTLHFVFQALAAGAKLGAHP
jgi:hypothetical protein